MPAKDTATPEFGSSGLRKRYGGQLSPEKRLTRPGRCAMFKMRGGDRVKGNRHSANYGWHMCGVRIDRFTAS